MDILKCANGQSYTGSTKNLDKRLFQHHTGEGSNFTRKNLPIELVYYKKFNSVDEAFLREKQIQKWSHAKKEALITGDLELLAKFSKNKKKQKVNFLGHLAPGQVR